MLRARLAKALLVAGIGLLSGCAGLSNHPLLGFFHHKSTVIGESCEGPICEGPVLQDYGPYPTTGSAGGTCGPMVTSQPSGGGVYGPSIPTQPIPGGTYDPGIGPQPMPPLGMPPRIEPRPATPEPFRPMLREFH